VIKYYPGLKEFIRERAPEYKPNRLDIQAYSQPPSFTFFGADEVSAHRIEIPKSASADEIEGLLTKWGVAPGSGSQEPPKVSECGEDGL
jgi:hypothetical protein